MHFRRAFNQVKGMHDQTKKLPKFVPISTRYLCCQAQRHCSYQTRSIMEWYDKGEKPHFEGQRHQKMRAIAYLLEKIIEEHSLSQGYDFFHYLWHEGVLRDSYFDPFDAKYLVATIVRKLRPLLQTAQVEK